MDESILLTCSSCGRREAHDRQPHDPPNAVELNFQECDRCSRGDFEMLTYYDASGVQICNDPATYMQRIVPPKEG